jgi:hypothetical protein
MITKEDHIATGVIDYFRNALAAVGRWSKYNNVKYPPVDGAKELRWSFDISTNHADAIASHLSQRGTIDPETGFSHSVALAWRSLALLESELVSAGAAPGLAVVRSEARADTIPAPADPQDRFSAVRAPLEPNIWRDGLPNGGD